MGTVLLKKRLCNSRSLLVNRDSSGAFDVELLVGCTWNGIALPRLQTKNAANNDKQTSILYLSGSVVILFLLLSSCLTYVYMAR